MVELYGVPEIVINNNKPQRRLLMKLRSQNNTKGRFQKNVSLYFFGASFFYLQLYLFQVVDKSFSTANMDNTTSIWTMRRTEIRKE